MKNTYLTIVLALATMAPTVFAAGSDWDATTHFGFAVVDRSSTGFEQVQGSLIFMDAVRNFDNIAVGIRTITQGGKGNGQEYYRLGAGPVFKWHSESWTVHGSIGAFKETAIGNDDVTHYQSAGQAYMLGWQRWRAITKSASISWGGFISGHQGHLTPASATYASHSKTNNGLSHGVEISLRMGL